MSTFLSNTVCKIFNLDTKKTLNLFGVEVEVEGPAPFLTDFGVNNQDLSNWWAAKDDGSLRGYSKEFVSKVFPTVYDAKKSVTSLYKVIGVVNDSMRCGVHVHYNVQHRTIQQLFTLLSLYYIFEPCLYIFLGEERRGNFFCLDTNAAGLAPIALNSVLENKSFNNVLFTNPDARYAALNLASIVRFGSIEFRALRTPVKAGPICTWLDIINYLTLAAKEFSNPVEVFSSFSQMGYDNLTRSIFKEYADAILNQPDFADLISNAIRNHQFWVFNNQWSN